MKEKKIPSKEVSKMAKESVKRIRLSIFKIIEFEAVQYSPFELLFLLVFTLIIILTINSDVDFSAIKESIKAIIDKINSS